MSKADIKTSIDVNIKQNNNQEITGTILNSVLKSMVDDYAEQVDLDQKVLSLQAAKADKNVVNALDARVVNSYNEINSLNEKIDDLSLGKFYGYFSTSSLLPVANLDGYAYVGENDVYVIYNAINGAWINSGVEIDRKNSVIINPDLYQGTDAQKLQLAIDDAISNGLWTININRTYDITGSTLMINKGIRYADEVSQYSRKKLCFIGLGIGKIIKEDEGFMFSSTTQSGDISFDSITFEGYTSDDNPVNVVDMRVFDCNKLIRLTMINCTFDWVGCVYYQVGEASQGNAQTIVSMGNLYTKTKHILHCDQLWDAKFIGDTMEDGYCVVEGWGLNSTYRDLKIAYCCIEGYSFHPAINLHCVASTLDVSQCYFEGNLGHIIVDRFFTGTIIGNQFHGRGKIAADVQINCISVALSTQGYIIDGNVATAYNDSKTCLIHFATDSAYYDQNYKIIGSNKVEGTTPITNVINNYIDKTGIASAYPSLLSAGNDYNIVSKKDILANTQETYPQITGGSIVFKRGNGCKMVDFTNVVLSSPITSGTCAAVAEMSTGDETQHMGSMVTNDGKTAILYVTSEGRLGIRATESGTYSGSICYF